MENDKTEISEPKILHKEHSVSMEMLFGNEAGVPMDHHHHTIHGVTHVCYDEHDPGHTEKS
jgi:hypothetical protein